jgi:hypothetical protein
LPHEPQFALSPSVFTHDAVAPVPHIICPVGHIELHAPATHT